MWKKPFHHVQYYHHYADQLHKQGRYWEWERKYCKGCRRTHIQNNCVLEKLCQQVIAERKTEGETETRRKSGEEKMTRQRRVGEKKISIISVNFCFLFLHIHKYPPLPQLCWVLPLAPSWWPSVSSDDEWGASAHNLCSTSLPAIPDSHPPLHLPSQALRFRTECLCHISFWQAHQGATEASSLTGMRFYWLGRFNPVPADVK